MQVAAADVGLRFVQSIFKDDFNQTLLAQFLAVQNEKAVKKTHLFNGRFENIYLDEKQVPLLKDLKSNAKRQAEKILAMPVTKMGCWFNAMTSGAKTTLHRHDEDDELLSAVYYIKVPENSGELTIHTPEQLLRHTPIAGQWVFFSPASPHEVSENLSDELRLSLAFNFS